jgi:hypothetical protein
VSKNVLTLLFAGLATLFGALAVLFGALAYRVAKVTLTYTRGRDLELDTRSGWIDIHKAMVNLREQRRFVMSKLGQTGTPVNGTPPLVVEIQRDYIFAAAQLFGQLDRLNDEPLIVELAKFLGQNKLASEWQTDKYATDFDAFAHRVALQSRPK